MNKHREELAKKYSECRVFIEFASAHKEQFQKWVAEELSKSIIEPKNCIVCGDPLETKLEQQFKYHTTCNPEEQYEEVN